MVPCVVDRDFRVLEVRPVSGTEDAQPRLRRGTRFVWYRHGGTLPRVGQRLEPSRCEVYASNA